MAPVLLASPGRSGHGAEGERGSATGEGGGYREGARLKRGRHNAQMAEEHKTSGAAPFSLYTEETGPTSWRAPLLTLPGKPPHRIASTARARG